MINEIMKNEILFCIGENTVHKTNIVFSNTSDINVCIYLILTFHKMVFFKMLNNFPLIIHSVPFNHKIFAVLSHIYGHF